jgi:hypothetical protein
MCPGLCKSDLGRQYTANSYLISIAEGFFFAVLGKSTEAGARTFILAAMAGPEENGKYIKHYGSTNAEYQLYVVSLIATFFSANNSKSTASQQRTSLVKLGRSCRPKFGKRCS